MADRSLDPACVAAVRRLKRLTGQFRNGCDTGPGESPVRTAFAAECASRGFHLVKRRIAGLPSLWRGYSARARAAAGAPIGGTAPGNLRMGTPAELLARQRVTSVGRACLLSAA
jgi:hypothetical protein